MCVFIIYFWNEIPNYLQVVVLHNVLSPADCHQYIAEAEKLGFLAANEITPLGKHLLANADPNAPVIWPNYSHIRTCMRLVCQFPVSHADLLYSLVSSYVPETFKDNTGLWRRHSLNPRFRFLKYQPPPPFAFQFLTISPSRFVLVFDLL